MNPRRVRIEISIMKNKLVLITGAGRGLGRAIAEAFYQDGFDVIATDIDLGLFSDIKDKEHFTCIKLDVTSESDTRHCADIVAEKFGKLDVLISNAGIVDFYPVSEAGSERLKKIFDVNVFGLPELTKYFLPLLLNSGGRLIVISSESYKVPSPFQPYAVSKQALESVYKSIKIELSLKGVRSILIRPGAIQTQLIDDTIHFSKTIENSFYKNEFSNFIDSISKYIGKISTAEDVAKVVLKAAIDKHPRRVYNINHNPLVSLLSHLPEKLKNFAIRISLK